MWEKSNISPRVRVLGQGCFWPLKPRTQSAASVCTCTDLCRTTNTARPSGWSSRGSSGSKSGLVVFGDGAWSVSVSGLLRSQAPAAFIWRAAVFLVFCFFLGGGHKLLERWALGGGGCSVTWRSLKHVWSLITPHLRGKCNPNLVL